MYVYECVLLEFSSIAPGNLLERLCVRWSRYVEMQSRSTEFGDLIYVRTARSLVVQSRSCNLRRSEHGLSACACLTGHSTARTERIEARKHSFELRKTQRMCWEWLRSVV
jgi:hypothetical protein